MLKTRNKPPSKIKRNLSISEKIELLKSKKINHQRLAEAVEQKITELSHELHGDVFIKFNKFLESLTKSELKYFYDAHNGTGFDEHNYETSAIFDEMSVRGLIE